MVIEGANRHIHINATETVVSLHGGGGAGSTTTPGKTCSFRKVRKVASAFIMK